jgi:hypothetical protein
MQQLAIPAEQLIPLDPEAPGLPEPVKQLQPVLYREGNTICCLLGPDKQSGISGHGETVEAALQDWMKSLNKRLDTSTDTADEVMQYVKDTLRTSKKDVW